MRQPLPTLALCLALLPALLPPAARGAELADPCTDSYDWLRLNSAEWLKGELQHMRYEHIEFKSDKLKTQKLKWKDVVELCLPKTNRFVIEDHTVLEGSGHLVGSELVVTTKNGQVKLERGRLVAVLPGQARELQRWRLKASLGLDGHFGNTDQSSLNSSLDIRREGRISRMQFVYIAAFGSADGTENVSRHRGEAGLDVYVTRRFYIKVLEGSAVYDKFQNIALRATPTSGLGYQIFDTNDFELSLEGGLGYQYSRYISVRPGDELSASNLSLRAAMWFKWDITGDLDLQARHESILVATNFGLTNYHTRATFTYDITDLLKIELTGSHDRVREPVAAADGTLPERDDVQLIIGLAVELR